MHPCMRVHVRIQDLAYMQHILACTALTDRGTFQMRRRRMLLRRRRRRPGHHCGRAQMALQRITPRRRLRRRQPRQNRTSSQSWWRLRPGRRLQRKWTEELAQVQGQCQNKSRPPPQQNQMLPSRRQRPQMVSAATHSFMHALPCTDYTCRRSSSRLLAALCCHYQHAILCHLQNLCLYCCRRLFLLLRCPMLCRRRSRPAKAADAGVGLGLG